MLEHLGKPRQAVIEIRRVVKEDGLVAISLPLENLTQKLLRIVFILMKIGGNPILKKRSISLSPGHLTITMLET